MRLPLVGIGLGLFLIVLGLVIGQLALVILGVALAILLGGISAMRTTQAKFEDPTEDLSPESRILIKPLRTMYNQVLEASEKQPADGSSFMAQEATAESKRLLEQSAAALKTRDQMAKDKRGEYEAEKSIADIQNRLAASSSEDEKTSLQSALAARQEELKHYVVLQQAISKIESSVKQAEAAMAEMRARMVSSNSAGLAEQGSDPLRDAVGRMRALSASMVEAQELLQK